MASFRSHLLPVLRSPNLALRHTHIVLARGIAADFDIGAPAGALFRIVPGSNVANQFLLQVVVPDLLLLLFAAVVIGRI